MPLALVEARLGIVVNVDVPTSPNTIVALAPSSGVIVAPATGPAVPLFVHTAPITAAGAASFGNALDAYEKLTVGTSISPALPHAVGASGLIHVVTSVVLSAFTQPTDGHDPANDDAKVFSGTAPDASRSV